MSETTESKPRSAMAITGLVLGIIALLTSALPIINNMSAIVGVLGAILALVGVVGCVRGKRAGRGLAIAALAVNIVAIVVVLATQSAYSAAIDDAMGAPDVVSVGSNDASDSKQDAEDDAKDDASAKTADLTPGTAVTLDNGLKVSVDSVENVTQSYDGAPFVAVHVTYVNDGDESASYNSLDWKGEDAQGAQESSTYFMDATDELSSGTLAAGGTKSGTIYLKDGSVKALYIGNMFDDSPSATWTLQ